MDLNCRFAKNTGGPIVTSFFYNHFAVHFHWNLKSYFLRQEIYFWYTIQTIVDYTTIIVFTVFVEYTVCRIVRTNQVGLWLSIFYKIIIRFLEGGEETRKIIT